MDRLAAGVATVLDKTATASLGVREIVLGITKRWFTPELIATWQHRGVPLAALCKAPSAPVGACERVHRASLALGAAMKRARRQYVTSEHKKFAKLSRL